MDGKLKCTRQGCQKEYLESDNSDTSCAYHDGKPIFHDVKKGWTCCEVVVYDWEEFMKIPGCKVNRHTNDANVKTDFFKSQTVNNAQKGIDSEPKEKVVIKDIKEYEKEQKEKEEERLKKEADKPKEPIVY
jgi:disease resistance protein